MDSITLLLIPLSIYVAWLVASHRSSHFIVVAIRMMVATYTATLLITLLRGDRSSILSILNKLGAGFPLPEKDYGDVCQVYVPDHPSGDPFHNVTDRIDIFVLAHSLGWFVKTMILRDVRVAWICSVMFEVIELCFAHVLPNFNECWWDSVVLDIFGCNMIGIHAADLVLSALRMKKFNFMKNAIKHSEINYKHLFSAVLLVVVISLIDLNFFFLKFVFFVPTTHWMAYARTLLWVLISIPSAMEMSNWSNVPISPARSRKSPRKSEQSFIQSCPSWCIGMTGLLAECYLYYQFRNDLFLHAGPTPIRTIILAVSLLYAAGWVWTRLPA